MPTFALNDEADTENERPDSYWRRFLAPTMNFLRVKKFMKEHDEQAKRHRETERLAAESRSRAKTEYEEKLRRHEAHFKPKSIQPADEVNCTDQQVKKICDAWLEEYNHPSCTANISVHEIVDRTLDPKSFKSPGNTSLLSETLPSHMFDRSSQNTSIFSDSVFLPTTDSAKKNDVIAGSLAMKTLNLDAYNGARPSFGGATFTSTPLQKKLVAIPSPAVPIIEESFETSKAVLSPDARSTLSKPQIFSASTPPSLFGSTPSIPTPKTKVESPAIVNLFTKMGVTPPTTREQTPKSIERSPEKASTSGGVSLCSYYTAEIDLKEDVELSKQRFEGKNLPLRGLIKRAVIEKISVSSKRLAKPEETSAAAQHLYDVIGGRVVEGADEPDAVSYTYDLIISHCIGVVERDSQLYMVVGRLLRSLSALDERFERILIGKLLSMSTLLRLSAEECASFAQSLPSDMREVNQIISREKSLIRLFLLAHIGDEVQCNFLTMSNLWRCVALAANINAILSTIILLTEVAEYCSESLSRAYPRQWKKFQTLIRDKLMPMFEEQLLVSEDRRKAGEGLQISLLRSLLEN